MSRPMCVKIFRGQHENLRENVADATGPVYRTTTREQLRNVKDDSLELEPDLAGHQRAI